MTPLAHKIVKELTLPVKDRTFNDQCGLLQNMDDVHCFDATAVHDLAIELANDLRDKDAWLEGTFFLPAPKTWIEFQEGHGDRIGFHIEDTGQGRFATVSTAVAHGTMKGTNTLVMGNHPDWNKPWFLQDGSEDTPRLLCAILAIINTPRIIGRKQHMPHRGLEKRLTKAKGLVGKFPLHAWTELKLSVSDIGKNADGTTHEAHHTGEKCLHFCRAHLRIRNGKLERVSAHWRGNPALGIKRTRYKLTD